MTIRWIALKRKRTSFFVCGQTRKRTQLYPGYRHEIHYYYDIKVDVEASIVD